MTTYQLTASLTNKKEIFDIIYMNTNMSGGIHEIIAEFLRDCSTTFVSDIATKYIEHKNPTEKQAWCMTFEFIKINHMLAVWIEKEIELINE